MQWLRRSFIAGFFVTVPLFITVAAFVWIFGIVDGLTEPLYERLLGRRVPGLGIVTTALGVCWSARSRPTSSASGCCSAARATCCACRCSGPSTRRSSSWWWRFRRTTSSASSRSCWWRTNQGYALGFLTKEFTIDRGAGPEPMVAVYVPTNHLYLGDIVICERASAPFPGHHRRGGNPDLSDRRNGAAAAGPRLESRRPREGLPSIIRRFLVAQTAGADRGRLRRDTATLRGLPHCEVR